MSLPPGTTTITWPIVAYAFVRELPYLGFTAAGCIACALVLNHGGTSALEPLLAALAPVGISALAKSRPAESEAILRMAGGGAGAGILALFFRRIIGG